MRMLFAYPFCKNLEAFYIQLDQSASYIGLEHKPEYFVHMLFTHTKVLFTYENAFCICFPDAPLLFLHMT